MALSDLCDLRDPKSGAHAHSKVMVFGVTVGTFVLLLLILALDRHVTWPLAALIVCFLYAPFGLDTIKAIAKLRYPKRGSNAH